MKVKLNKEFPIPTSPEAGWRFLQDISRVAECMPGAQITESIDDRNHKGIVKMKMGPVSMTFNGSLEVVELNEEARKLRLIGKGGDTKGTSSAELDLTVWIEEGADANSFELKGESEVTVIGKAASLGGRMMSQLSDQLLNIFGDNFSQKVVAFAEGSGESSAGEPEKPSDTASLAPAQKNELNALPLMVAAVVGFIKEMLGKRRT